MSTWSGVVEHDVAERWGAGEPAPEVRDLAPADDQMRRVQSSGFPAEEIALQLYDGVQVFLPRLRENALIDSVDVDLLRSLVDRTMSVQPALFGRDGSVTDAPEWAEVRQLASAALANIRRPPDEKSPT